MDIKKLVQEDKTKRTGYEWEQKLGLKLIDIDGFKSQEFYTQVKISKEDFILMASNCQHEKPAHQTRQEAGRLKKFLSIGMK